MLSVTELLAWLEATQTATFVSQSTWAFPSLLMVHMTASAIVVGMIAVVDLRLLGLASNKYPVSELCRDALPWTWGAFAVAALTGAFLFLAQPAKYFNNSAFQMKFGLIAVAGINMLVFHFLIYRGVSAWDRDAAVPPAARLAGAISLLAWIAVVAYGRWTAYFMV